MLKTMLLTVSILLASQSVLADSFWEHNGSLMRLESDGSDKRVFSYEQPSSRMRGAGVERGTVLFEGRRVGDDYVGTARVFSSNCGPLEYRVHGVVRSTEQQQSVVLYGTRERYNQQTCTGTGVMVEDRLVFNYRYSD